MSFLKKKRSKVGQATFEFAMVFVLFLAMLSLTYNAMIAFTIHQYLSYVTFMSARAFQSSHTDIQQQIAMSANTFNKYLPGAGVASNGGTQNVSYPLSFNGGRPLAFIHDITIPSFDAISAGGLPSRQATASPVGGFAITYDVQMVNLPIGDGLKKYTKLRFDTRSFLGRDPTVRDCVGFFRNFFANSFPNVNGNEHEYWGMEDTGC